MALVVTASWCEWGSGFLRFSIVGMPQVCKHVLVGRAIRRAQELGDGEAEGVGEFFYVVDGNVTSKGEAD